MARQWRTVQASVPAFKPGSSARQRGGSARVKKKTRQHGNGRVMRAAASQDDVLRVMARAGARIGRYKDSQRAVERRVMYNATGVSRPMIVDALRKQAAVLGPEGGRGEALREKECARENRLPRGRQEKG